MNIKQLQEVYQSTIDWLKFLEAKIIAVLTLESGFFYCIFKMDIFQNMNCIKIICCLCSILSIGLLVWGIFPRFSNNTNNPLYYQSWLHKSLISSKVNEQHYVEQLQLIVRIINQKTKLLKFSLLTFSLAIISLILAFIF